ncbi:MAG: hypothetical protein KatS3mg003_1194 [Candidatus Nitrosocaldaceae archaeon]|nr:MAG: hypothetical protein KatS3mg003_1194 [Candidatus Nitrosocaldaceae archaeon]
MSRISNNSNLIDVLNALKTKALRKGLWHKTLNNKERILINMIVKHVRIVRNATLATVIAKIIGKLFSVIKGSFIRKLIGLGLDTVNKWAISASLVNWNVSEWFDDLIILWFGMYKATIMK